MLAELQVLEAEHPELALPQLAHPNSAAKMVEARRGCKRHSARLHSAHNAVLGGENPHVLAERVQRGLEGAPYT